MKLLKCKICGKLIEVLEDGAPTTICCGDEMIEVKPNTVDAAVEKHVPFTQIEGDKVMVKVGEVLHPMLDEHYINFVVADYGDKITRVNFKPNSTPEAIFEYKKGMKIYSYCNLHGLWVKEL